MTLSIALLTYAFSVSAQPADSTRRAPESWKHFYPGIRLAGGFQRTFFTEAGIAMQRYGYADHHGFVAVSYYLSYVYSPPAFSKKRVHGIAGGAEIANNGSAGAIEARYLTDDDSSTVVLTPKIGLGIGMVNVFYGYNIYTSPRAFTQLGKHQVSLVINTNMLLYYAFKKKKHK